MPRLQRLQKPARSAIEWRASQQLNGDQQFEIAISKIGCQNLDGGSRDGGIAETSSEVFRQFRRA